VDIHKELTFQLVFNGRELCFYRELKEFVVRMKQQILNVLLPFIFFMHAFDKRRGHNMLALMFDPNFKSMKLIFFLKSSKCCCYCYWIWSGTTIAFINKNNQVVDVATLTSGSQFCVEHKGTWGQKVVFKSETHSHKWGKVQKIEPNDSQMHSHFGNFIHARISNI
jgi:hypothetical protein